MRLLDTSTARFRYIDHPKQASYAILSHVWDHKDGEQSLQDILEIRGYTQQNMGTTPTETGDLCPPPLTILSSKIRDCCVFARLNGYRYLWADTCCIDKTSSAELSEAINSMYEWYSRAAVCYVYLADVDDHENPRARTSSFRRSRWFRRGWTLQELIAPALVIFLSRNWCILGMKDTLADVIEEITGIDVGVLTHRRSLDSVSVARRMSWAATRETTREEDEAYSLMGLFNVHMATIYGEGRKAFTRLQREILEHCPDQTIFAWGHIFPDHTQLDGALGYHTSSPFYANSSQSRIPVSEDAAESCLFASSPAAFAESANVVPIPLGTFSRRIRLAIAPPHYTVTSYGVHVKLPVLADGSQSMFLLAVLACEDGVGNLIALMLHGYDGTNQHIVGDRILLGRASSRSPNVYGSEDTLSLLGRYYRCTVIRLPSEATTASGPRDVTVNYRPRWKFILCDFYLPSQQYPTIEADASRESLKSVDTAVPRSFSFAGPCEIALAPWLPAQLEQFGYKLSFSKPRPRTTRRTLTHPGLLRFDWADCWSHILTLTNDIDITLDIHLLLCPHDSSEYPPVHAVVMAREPDSTFYWSTFRQAPACDTEHVDRWPNASKVFGKSSWSAAVRLTFGRVSLADRADDAGPRGFGDRWAVYNLLIDVTEPVHTIESGILESRWPDLHDLYGRELALPERADWGDGEADSTTSESDEEDGDEDDAAMVEEHPVNFVSVRFTSAQRSRPRWST